MQATSVIKLSVCLLLASTVKAVAEGVGKVYITHYYKPSYYPNSKAYGVSIIYRPENYKKYADDINFDAQIGFYNADSKATLESKYEDEVIDEHDDWDYMSWDDEGKYFYHYQFSGSVLAGDWIGFGVAIYHGLNNLVYEDLDRYYLVPPQVVNCDLDEIASRRDFKCSEALLNNSAEVGDLSSNSNGKISKPLFEVGPVSVSFPGPWIATGVVVPLVLIAVIVGVVYARRNGCATIRNARLAASFSKQPNQQVVHSQMNGYDGPQFTVNATIPQFHVQTSTNEPTAQVHMTVPAAPAVSVRMS